MARPRKDPPDDDVDEYPAQLIGPPVDEATRVQRIADSVFAAIDLKAQVDRELAKVRQVYEPRPPVSAPWLPPDTPELVAKIIRGAIERVAIHEQPLGSNRGPQIDDWNRLAGVSVGSYWCAAFVAAVWRDAGAALPPITPGQSNQADCDSWMRWAKRYGYFSPKPVLGGAVLYGVPTDAKHIGIVICTEPGFVASIEGNTTVEGSQLERNGTAVALKLVTGNDPVIGFIRPVLFGEHGSNPRPGMAA